MLKKLFLTCMYVSSVFSIYPAEARERATSEPPARIYLMRGYGGTMTSSGVDEIGRKLQAQAGDRPVLVGNWEEWRDFVADALASRATRVVLVGFSKGSESATQAAGELAARQVRVKIVGLDPFCMKPVVPRLPEIDAVNIYRNSCGSIADGTMDGAENVRLGSGGGGLPEHLAMQHDPAVQALVVEAALKEAAGPLPAGRRIARR